MISKYLDKDNLHHAYLIEGDREKVVPEILKFLEGLNIKTSGNPDFCHIVIDNFKMEEAVNLRGMGSEKGFSSGKKIFVVCANSFTLDAQGTLLKMFEEPIENTHFFLIIPDVNSLLRTLVSRFYFISTKADLSLIEAEKFISMSLQKRIDFIKELLPKKDENDEEDTGAESNSSKALKFLNALESVIHNRLLKNSEWCGSRSPRREGSSQKNFSVACVEHFFKVRKFLRMPGSSAKTLMESVAIVIPNL